MSWTQKTVKNMAVYTETVTLPASATTGYTSAISIDLGSDVTKYISLVCTASAVTGTNVDISLYGSLDGTTYVQLKDAPGSIADLTNSAKTAGASFDLKAYPMPYYKIGLLTDVDESANTVAVGITVM